MQVSEHAAALKQLHIVSYTFLYFIVFQGKLLNDRTKRTLLNSDAPIRS